MMPSMPDPQRYVPAAGRDVFTGLYDRVMALTMREGAWRPSLTQAVVAGLRQGGVVIDVGAGTATQAIAIAAARPDAQVIGVDGDPEILALAATKPGAERIRLRLGRAAALDVPDRHADRLILSLVLHHLVPDEKVAALREARRVLRPDGELHIADWGRPSGALTRAGFLALQMLDGSATTRDHASGRWLAHITAAGFAAPRIVGRLRTPWGVLEQLITGPAP
jgi:ubiquinone/menaquinone biosynthesis C-methylase UbiE